MNAYAQIDYATTDEFTGPTDGAAPTGAINWDDVKSLKDFLRYERNQPAPTPEPFTPEPITPDQFFINSLKCENAIPDFIRKYLRWGEGIKANIHRDYLTRALYVAKSVIERKGTLPILRNVKLAESGGKLQVVGTDLDLEITVTVPADVEPNFSTTAPAHQLHDLLAKSRKSDAVSFAIENDDKAIMEDWLEIDTGKTQFKLGTLESADFPILEFDTPDNSFTLDGDVFRNMINNVAGAISTEETRYYLNGVYFHEYEYDNQLVAVATDGHRLYHQTMDMPIGGHGMEGHIIPRETIATFLALTKAAKNRPDKVTVSINKSKIEIAFDNVVIRSKVIDGTFPDYHRVIPSNPSQYAAFDADQMNASIKDVTLISSDRGRAVKVSITGDDMELTVNNPESGSASASITGQGGDTQIDIGFNAQYLTDILNIVSGGAAQFGLTNSGSPTVITGSIEGWKAVLMPKRI